MRRKHTNTSSGGKTPGDEAKQRSLSRKNLPEYPISLFSVHGRGKRLSTKIVGLSPELDVYRQIIANAIVDYGRKCFSEGYEYSIHIRRHIRDRRLHSQRKAFKAEMQVIEEKINANKNNSQQL